MSKNKNQHLKTSWWSHQFSNIGGVSVFFFSRVSPIIKCLLLVVYCKVSPKTSFIHMTTVLFLNIQWILCRIITLLWDKIKHAKYVTRFLQNDHVFLSKVYNLHLIWREREKKGKRKTQMIIKTRVEIWF